MNQILGEVVDEKYKVDNDTFWSYLSWLEGMEVETQDLLSNFPAYVGSVNLARFLTIYDAYREVGNLSGHIADIGTFKGASFFTLGKLVKIFEPYSNTKVIGFDWFEGQKPGPNDNHSNAGKYESSKERLLSLIERQGLSGLMELVDMDLTEEYSNYIADSPHLRFKLAFIDIGMEAVLTETVSETWNRLVPGGILLVDHFNHETSPTESRIVQEAVGESRIEQAAFSRSPTGIIRKP